MSFWKNKGKRLLAISVILMVISMSVAGMLQTNFGTITVKDIRTETDAGLTLSGLLYVPDTATAENPAPAVVVAHGWWKTRESQSSTALELARRGCVVLCIDMYGHGNSSNKKFAFVDAYNGLELLSKLPYVDSERLGITGHSMGGKTCTAATKWANAGGPVDVAAMVIAGTDPVYQDDNGNWVNIYGNRDVCLIAARYDDFEYHGSEIHGPWLNAPRDYATTDQAKSFVNFGADPAECGEVEVGKIYEKEIDGKTARRVLYTPSQIHSWFVLSPRSTGYTVSFLQDSLNAPNPLPATNQLGFIKELFTALGLVGMFMFVVALVYVLVDTAPFACLKAKKEVVPLEKPKGAGMAWFWGSVLVTAAISCVTLFPVATYVLGSKVNPLLPVGQARALGVWGVISGAATLLSCWLNYQFYGKKHGFDLRERGVILPKGTFWKTVLLSVIVVVSSYSFVYVADYFFKVDFRFWTFAARAFESDKAMFVMAALPLYLMYYIPNSIATNCFRYNKLGGDKEWVNTLVVSVGNALGCIVLLAIQYGTFVATGFSMWHATGAIKSAIGWTYAIVAILILAPIIARKIYKKTNNPYLAGIINGALVAIISTTNTTAVLETLSNYIPG